MGIDAVFQSLLEYGVLGAAVVLLVLVVVRKDKQVNALYIRLVEKSERDAEKYQELAAAQSEVLAELVGEIQEYRQDVRDHDS